MTVGGPTLAIAGGIAGGVAVDNLTTRVESSIANEYRPNGVYYITDRIKKGEASASEIFDAANSIALDGVAGYVAGKSVQAKAAAKVKFQEQQSQQVAAAFKRCESKPLKNNQRAACLGEVRSKSLAPVQSVPVQSHCSSCTDGLMLLNARPPIGKPDTEDENMKVLKLLNDVKTLQKKWKGKL